MPGVVSPGLRKGGVKLTRPRRVHRAAPPLPLTVAWLGATLDTGTNLI
jgi:hypothetical protein